MHEVGPPPLAQWSGLMGRLPVSPGLESPYVDVFEDPGQVLLADLGLQVLHLPLIGQDQERGHLAPVVLQQHPGGERLVVQQVKPAQTVGHGHPYRGLLVHVEVFCYKALSLEFNLPPT